MLQELSNELISLRRMEEGEGGRERVRETERERGKEEGEGGRKEVEEEMIRLNNNGAYRRSGYFHQ